ncbi:MAG: hypothetical protein U5K27_17050 [Desulfotignum sp.]|nr:hypothetical protein [Desulfotignum sp.]
MDYKKSRKIQAEKITVITLGAGAEIPIEKHVRDDGKRNPPIASDKLIGLGIL